MIAVGTTDGLPLMVATSSPSGPLIVMPASIGVPDNSNNWTMAEAAVMPYMSSANITKDGTLAGSWQWEYGETFSDLSVNSNTATPSFRTAGSNANVTAELISFQPIAISQASENVSTAWPSPYEVPDTPTGTYTEEARPTGIFLEPLIHAIWSITDLPDSFFWYNFSFFVIIMVGMLVQKIFAINRQNALLLKLILMGAVMVFWSLPGINIYGMYVVVYFVLWCFGVLVLSRNYGW